MPRTVSNSDLRRVRIYQTKCRGLLSQVVLDYVYRPVPLAGRRLWSRVEAPLSESVPLFNLLALSHPRPVLVGSKSSPLSPKSSACVAAPTVHCVSVCLERMSPDGGVRVM